MTDPAHETDALEASGHPTGALVADIASRDTTRLVATPVGAKGHTLADMAGLIGEEIAVSDWMTIEQARIDAFAACTGDDQWLHTDAERAAAESPFGTTIAHGFLMLALLTPLQRDAGAWPTDAVSIVNYGLETVRFVSPVPSGARVRNRAVLAGIERRGDDMWLVRLDNTLEIDGQQKPALVATSLLMIFCGAGASDGRAELA
jgi:acyl dehydratase